MERLLTGRRIGLAFGVDEDAFVLAGQTNAADLADQLRLLADQAHPSALGRRPCSPASRPAAVESYRSAFRLGLGARRARAEAA